MRREPQRRALSAIVEGLVSFGDDRWAALSRLDGIPVTPGILGVAGDGRMFALLALGLVISIAVGFVLEKTALAVRRLLRGDDELMPPPESGPFAMQTAELRLGLDLVRKRREALAPRLRQVELHHRKYAKALEDFRGTQAEADLEARFRRVELAREEAARATERLCDLEAQLWMQNAAFLLATEVKRRLSTGAAVSVEALAELRERIENEVRDGLDVDVRQRTWRGSAARGIVDDAQESLREHLAALKLRELEASGLDETRGASLDALVLEIGRSATLDEEMRAIDAHTEAVLEVERMLA